MAVYVVLFNARTENEGIHSLQMEGRQLVLMFEVEDDATRFSVMLEAQDFPPAAVEAFDREEIEEFCESAGYEAVMVEDGTLLMPPEKMVEETTWDPDADPMDIARAKLEAAAGEGQKEISKGSVQDASSDEMDRISAQLEKLLYRYRSDSWSVISLPVSTFKALGATRMSAAACAPNSLPSSVRQCR